MLKLTNQFFTQNRNKLLSKLSPGSTVVLFSSEQFPLNGDQFYKFRQNSDTFYFSGLEQEETIIVLSKDLENKISEYAFIIKPNISIETWIGHKYSKEEAKQISGIENIEYLEEYHNTIDRILNKNTEVYISFASNYRGGIKYINKKNEELISLAHRKSQDIRIENIDNISKDLRLIKSEEEIAIMKEAIKISKTGFYEVLKATQPNIYENQIEALLTYSFISNGASGHAYAPIVAAGENNCTLHHITNKSLCKSGDLLLLDFGAEYSYFASDVSRTIPISGRFTDFQKRTYNSVLKVLKQIKRAYIPGSTISSINIECYKLIEDELLSLEIISKSDIANQRAEDPIFKKYFMHGVCHFLGLDVHDVGDRETILKPGMVLTCEPGIYIKEMGFGIRLENDILITDNKPIDLCSDIPIEADEIEEIMNLGK